MGDESAQPRREALSDSGDEGRVDYSEAEDRLALYEWVGGLVAGLGFFATPILTAIPAGYCAYKIRNYKPGTALIIVALVITSAIFWVGVYLYVILPSL